MHRKPGTDASTRPSRKTVSSKQSVAARPHLDRSAATNQGVLQSLRVGPLRVEVGIVLILLELLLLLLLLVVVRKHGLVRLPSTLGSRTGAPADLPASLHTSF